MDKELTEINPRQRADWVLYLDDKAMPPLDLIARADYVTWNGVVVKNKREEF